MFTVEQAVENWKNDLRQKQTVMESDIEELESHLREEMERLAPLGLSEEETFLIATRRIGDTTQMAAEFAKVNTAAIWKNRFFWMVLGVILLQLFSTCSNFMARLGAILTHQFAGLSWFGTGILNVILQTVLLLVFLYVFYTGIIKTSLSQKISKYNAVRTIIVLVILSFLVNVILGLIYPILLARMYTPEQIGQYSLGLSYSALGPSILWPILWPVLLLWLMPRKTQTA